jgi:glutamyl-tRNA reductase
MAVWMIGVDHTRADIDVRSVFSFTKKKIQEAYDHFRSCRGLSGSVILSTCNRMEWWLSVSEDAGFDPAALLCDFLGLDEKAYGPYLTERRDDEAVEHFFRLAAGLESRIVGEDQIITQVGEALQLSRACYAADHTLEVLFRQGITAGKRVKTETDLSSADSSVIHTALRMLEEKGFSVAGKKCMVIGNGMMGRISASTLAERGADVTVTVRQYHSGIVDIPRDCKRIGYKERYSLLPQCQLVVSATSSPNYTIQRKDLEQLSPDHDILLVDLAVPRDIEVEAGELPRFTLYDIDAFQIDLRSEKFQRNLAKAEAILAEEKAEFYNWYSGREIVPRIQALKQLSARDVDARLTPVFRGVPLEAEDKAALRREVEGAAQRMMNRLLFGARAKLPEDVFSQCVDAMEEVFREQGAEAHAPADR